MPLSQRIHSLLAPLAIALLAANCGNGPTGDRPPNTSHANVSIVGSLSADAAAAAPRIHAAGLDPDHVHVTLAKAGGVILRDTTIALTAGQNFSAVLDVAVDAGANVVATLNYLSGSVALYTGNGPAVAYAVGTPANQIPTATISVAPVVAGSAATRVTVDAPPPSPVGAPLALTAHAFLASGAEIPNALFVWSVDDATIATISGTGVLQPTAKTGTVQVTATTISGVAATIGVTFYGPPARIVTVSGDAQTAAAGSVLPQPFVVQVQSESGTPVPNQTVTFGAANGSAVDPTTATTDANGRAQTLATLGTTPGPYGFSATAASFSTSINATATVGAAASMEMISGDAQRDAVQKTLTNPLVVRVIDRVRNPVPGVTVNWARTQGAGAVAAPTSTTDASGQASMTYTLGATPGSETIVASVTGIDATVTFGATALPKPTSIALFSGGGQNGTTGKTLPAQVVFKVLDTQGNPSSNVSVTFAVTGGGGSVNPLTATTDAAGTVATTWTLGSTVGTQTMTASATGLTGSPVSVSATAALPAAVALQFVQQPTAVASLSAISPPVTVRAIDADGNLVSSFTGAVTLAIGTNPSGATLGGTVTRSAVSGVATFNDITLNAPGTGYTLQASSTGLTTATSTAFNVSTAPAAQIHWTNASGGAWSVASNWSLNRVPVGGDTVIIDLAGTYSVNLTTPFVASMLVVGGAASGQQTLAVLTQSLTVSKELDVKPGGTLSVSSDGTGAPTVVHVSTGFTNDGTIDLTNTAGTGASSLVVSGTLVNSTTGVIDASPGTGGSRAIDAQLDNRGHLNVLAPLQLSYSGAATATHNNTGTVSVTGGDLALVETAGSSFTSSGTITVAAGRTWSVNGGAFNVPSGTMSGAGTLALTNVTGTFGITYALGGLTMVGGVANLANDLSTLNTAVSIDGSTINGPGRLLNAAGHTATLAGATIAANSGVVNDGTLLITKTTTINGSTGLTTSGGSTITVQGAPATGAAQLVVASGFTNNGTLQLTSSGGTAQSTITVTSGALVNALNSTIAADGSGARILNAQLTNHGAITVDAPLSISVPGATQTSDGTITLTNGDLSIDNGNGAGSFTSSGALSIGAGRTLSITNGAFGQQGALSGAGTLTLTSVAATLANGNLPGAFNVTGGSVNVGAAISTATTAMTFQQTTISGQGPVTNAATRTLTMRAVTVTAMFGIVNDGILNFSGINTVNAPFTASASSHITIADPAGAASVTVGNGLTNSGVIDLTSTNAAFGASVNVTSGNLQNASGGTINVTPGAGPRTINASLVNQGTLNVNADLTLSDPLTSEDNTATGTIVVGATLTIQQTTGQTFSNHGTMTINPGKSVIVLGGSFVHSSGANLNGGGTFAGNGADVTFGDTFALQSLVLTASSIGRLNVPFTTSGGMSIILDHSTLQGSGQLTNASGNLVQLQNSAGVTVTFANSGTLEVSGTNTIGFGFTTTSTSAIRIEGDNTGTAGGLTVPAFTNNGSILLTSASSLADAVLNVSVGPFFTNAGTITADAGVGGSRRIIGTVQNNGTINVGQNNATTLAISGGYSTTTSGILNMFLGGTAAGSYSVLQTNTSTTTATTSDFARTTVNVSYLGSFTAASGNAFTILNYSNGSTVTGATFNLPGGNGLWTQTNSGTGYTITRN